MTHKERILATLNRQQTDRAPIDLWHTPEIGAALRKHFNVSDDLDVYRAMGLDKIAWVFMDYKTEIGERAGGQSGAGAGGQGYICCSCHNVQAGTPLENIFAMVETVMSPTSPWVSK